MADLIDIFLRFETDNDNYMYYPISRNVRKDFPGNVQSREVWDDYRQ